MQSRPWTYSVQAESWLVRGAGVLPSSEQRLDTVTRGADLSCLEASRVWLAHEAWAHSQPAATRGRWSGRRGGPVSGLQRMAQSVYISRWCLVDKSGHNMTSHTHCSPQRTSARQACHWEALTLLRQALSRPLSVLWHLQEAWGFVAG